MDGKESLAIVGKLYLVMLPQRLNPMQVWVLGGAGGCQVLAGVTLAAELLIS
jgi:hypothetical protein